MKIAIPTADYPPIEGGISSVSLHLSRALAALGHEVTVIAPWFPDMKSFDHDEPVEVLRFRGYGLSWFRFFPMFRAALSPMHRADLVLAINISYGGIMAWLMGARYVTFGYAYEFLKFAQTPFIGAILKRVYNKSCRTVSISSYTTKQLVEFGVDSGAIETIFPGAPVPRTVGTADMETLKNELGLGDAPVLLAVGRLIERKGHATLLDAMPGIVAKHPDLKLVIVGRGPLRESLAGQISTLNIEDAVTLSGFLDDDALAALYALCSLFVLPTGEDSRGQVEGFGLVFAEANAYGKSVVAGSSGGVIDAVVDGETGILVEPGNVDACAAAVIDLLDNPDRARAMGEAGRQRVASELNWEHFAAQLMSTVESAQ